MKKTILTLAIALLSLASFAAEVNVNSRVLTSFNIEFKSAKEVKWTAGSNYYKAAFVLNNQHVFAFYNVEGELLGLTRYISSLDLPIALQTSLKKEYAEYWISDLFEVSNASGTSYYMTVEDADRKVVLQSSNGSDWSVYQKTTKA
jgi:hypothetical protein